MKLPWKILGHIWASPLTFWGLLLYILQQTTFICIEPADWSFHFYAGRFSALAWVMRKMGIGALTIGTIIVYQIVEYHNDVQMVKHERVHVRQGMTFGVFHLLFYMQMSLLAWAYGQDVYRGNEAEEQARAESGEAPQPKDIAPKDHSGGQI